MHLLIPFASCQNDAARQLLQGLKLPRLQRLLSCLSPLQCDEDSDRASATSFSPPHERVLARLLGLSAEDGLIPWAAYQDASGWNSPAGAAWGWITPCHWQVGRDQMQMDPPAALDLQESESQVLFSAMQPYFEEDGIHLIYVNAGCWLARSDHFRNLATAALDRVIGNDPAAWLPRGDAAALMRRLQNEMQMLLYTHPVNDARGERGLTLVNSFWLSGTGALPPQNSTVTRKMTPPQHPIIPRKLADAALHQDWSAWAQAWQEIDAGPCAELLCAWEHKGPPERARLTLCGERSAQTWGAEPLSLLRRAQNILTRQSLVPTLDSL